MISSGTNRATILGSKQKVRAIGELLEGQSADPAFVSFCSRVSKVIQALGSESADAIAVNDSHQVRLFNWHRVSSFRSHQSHQITEYRFIKVKYESKVDWRTKTDYLRCNPKFNGRPRFDFIIADCSQGCVFAQLVFVFICRVSGQDHHLALVQPLEKKSRANTRSADKSLSISRWHIQARNRCEVIHLDCIVRGAVLVADTKYKGDYFVIDTLDDDMFLRVKSM